MILSLKRPENHLICILLSVPSQKRPGGIGILFFWHFFCIKLKITMKVLYFLHGFLISFLVLIMSASNVEMLDRDLRLMVLNSKAFEQQGCDCGQSRGKSRDLSTVPWYLRFAFSVLLQMLFKTTIVHFTETLKPALETG